MKENIIKHALQNASKFKGKASLGAVIGKILAENPKLKENFNKIKGEIASIVEEVNSWTEEKQKKELGKYSGDIEKKEKDERDLFSVFKITKEQKIVTAFPPEPSKYPHIGHAKSILLNYELAKRKNGKFILRFEDTNPKLAEKEFYKIHEENYSWLGIKADEIAYASDHMEKFYELAKKMIKDSHAYVCTCPQEKIKEKRMAGEECECRILMEEEHLTRYEEMFDTAEGKMILRLKGYMQHDNSAMRDPALLRIIKAEHPRLGKKYSVWPTYDFENSVMDGLQEVSHRLRTKEFELRNELQGHIQAALGFKQTTIYEYARFNLEGVESSGRVIRELIQKKKLLGWDDPSLTTLVALRRRGFLPQAIKNFVLSTGISKSESTLTWDDLIVHNKRLLDSSSNRYFLIHNAKEIEIKDAPEQEVKLKIHPDFKERGFRNFKTSNKFYFEKEDFEKLKEKKIHRLMDCLNFKKQKGKMVFDSLEYECFKKNSGSIIHWLPKSDNLVKVEVMMPDKKIVKGIAEPSVKDIKENEVVQFARFGFCRLDKKEKNKLTFWYTHK
ncbi:glutamate--tRNA ligase [Candidatus Woesearchaeota archaeon]|nr:glutamate--tRNA ligase [Candidatus Woesearchaeota archaeon]